MMKFFEYIRSARCAALLLCLSCGVVSFSVHAQHNDTASSSSTASDIEAASSSSSEASVAFDVERDSRKNSKWKDWDSKDWDRRDWRGQGWHNHELVSIGHDATLAAGERAQSVVAVLGSATSEGEVNENVVAVLGNTRVTGPVGEDVVSVLGNTYINNTVGHDVVAVLGSVELGPQAVIEGELVTVGGEVTRDPAAVVRGGVQGMSFGYKPSFAWLRSWVDHCLLYGRPLAIAPGLGWAWTLAVLALLSYLLTAAMAPRAVARCVTTMETSPGYSLLAALLATLASPILFVLLVITVIGMVAIPFLGIALLCVSFFGKLVMLAWIGRRITSSVRSDSSAHAVLATLIGGVIVTALYLVPIVGFIVYKLLGFIGFGVVVYTLILMFKQRRQAGGDSGGESSAGDFDSPKNQRSNQSTPRASFVEQGDTATDTAESINANDATATVAPAASVDLISLPRATFGMRMGALLLDLVLVAFILNLILHLNDILLLTVAIYGAVMWKLKGTTIGGILFNLRVVRLDGREVDWPTAVVRALSCFLSLIALGLGFIWIALDPERQAWHDKIAGTVVVRTPNGASLV